MFKKKDRLTKAQFDLFFKSGKRFHSPLFQLIYTPHQEFHGAAVVGKKVYKNAVERNQLRRRLYGALYRYQKQNNLKGVFIIIAKPPAKNLTQKETAPTLVELLEKVSH